MIKGLIALAFGALSFGVSEFVVMGLLPYFAMDFDVEIATAGHTISAYAFGVCFGVFYMMFSRKLNLKLSICIVVFCHLLGMVLTAVASDFIFLLIARFISGLPHGCFFGLGAIIASRIATAGHGSSAMALMLAGQTVSNVFGVPLGTALAHNFSWRAIFVLMTIWAVLVLLSLWRWLPDPSKMEDHGFMKQFEFLKKRAPYLIGLSILLGNGGLFCLQSYVSPILTDFMGLDLAYVPTVLIVMGIAMTIYNLIAGRLSDIFTPAQVSLAIFISCIAAAICIFFFGNMLWLGLVLMVYCTGCLFGLSTPQQVSILRVSPGGELIGVAFGQVAFNFGNAVGAFLGGLPMEHGYGVQYTVAVSVGLMSLGTLALLFFSLKDEAYFSALYKAAQQKRMAEARAAAEKALAINIEADRDHGTLSVSVANNADEHQHAEPTNAVAETSAQEAMAADTPRQ